MLPGFGLPVVQSPPEVHLLRLDLYHEIPREQKLDLTAVLEVGILGCNRD